MIEEEDGSREGHSKNLEQRETIINLGPDQKAIEKFRLALPGLQGRKGSCWAGPLLHSRTHKGTTLQRTCQTHFKQENVPQKGGLRDFLFQFWTFIHIFVLLALHPQVFFVDRVPLFNLQAVACSFLSSEFPCFPLTSVFFPKLRWVSPLVGQPSWGFVPPDRTLILSPARQTSPMPQEPWKGSLRLLPKAKKSHGYKLHSVCTEIYYSFYY